MAGGYEEPDHDKGLDRATNTLAVVVVLFVVVLVVLLINTPEVWQ